MVGEYYRSVSKGAAAVVRQTQGGLLLYTLTKIDGVNPRLGRVYVEGFGAFYSKHGRNCFHPKGQTDLVVPAEPVLRYIRKHPDGLFFGKARWDD